MSDEEIILAREQKLMQAVVLRDAGAFAELLDPEYYTVNEDGSAMNAAEVLAEMRGPAPLRMDAEPAPSEAQLRVIGPTALRTARFTFESGGKTVADLRYLEVWIQRQGEWKLAHWQATRVTPEGLEREARAKALASRVD